MSIVLSVRIHLNYMGISILSSIINSSSNSIAFATVYIMMHTELDADGYERPMTVGKLLSEKVCIEGLFTTVLKSVYEGGEYKFRTKTNGADCVKTPLDMFQTETIDNDLKLVDRTIREYYGMTIPYKEDK